MIKGVNPTWGYNIVNVYTVNTKTCTYLKQILTALKREIATQ